MRLNFLKKNWLLLLGFLTKNTRWILWALFIIALLLFIIFFRAYALKPKLLIEETTLTGTKIKLELYQKIVEALDRREQSFQQTIGEGYRDIFR